LLEAIGDDKVRINSTSLDKQLVILANQALERVAVGKHVVRVPRAAEYLNIDPEGFSQAGCGPETMRR
jgi:hypothetical protein